MAKPQPKAPESVLDVPRNDIAACRAFYKARRGKVTGEDLRVLLQLQDDDTELLQIMTDERWGE
jgi:hypothetical protein